MTLRLLALALVAGSGLIAADLEFSHELHLAQGLSCTVCHSSVSGSDEASDVNLPQAALCQACHNGQTAPQIDASPLEDREPQQRGFWFSHEQHLALGNAAPKIAAAIDSGKYLGFVPDIRAQLDTDNACVACHRGLEAADTTDSKLHLPKMADCLVCHDKIENPFSCEECHPPDFDLKPASHTPNFIDVHSTGRYEHDKRTCEPCHGRTFTCMGCH